MNIYHVLLWTWRNYSCKKIPTIFCEQILQFTSTKIWMPHRILCIVVLWNDTSCINPVNKINVFFPINHYAFGYIIIYVNLNFHTLDDKYQKNTVTLSLHFFWFIVTTFSKGNDLPWGVGSDKSNDIEFSNTPWLKKFWWFLQLLPFPFSCFWHHPFQRIALYKEGMAVLGTMILKSDHCSQIIANIYG